jgi:metal-responsive CopG/Arc/MetJ family transcriptional regulator
MRNKAMPTNNPRMNVTLDQNLMDEINLVADQEQVSASKLVRELIIEAFEKREDRFFSQIADSRDTKSKKTVKHDEAWK